MSKNSNTTPTGSESKPHESGTNQPLSSSPIYHGPSEKSLSDLREMKKQNDEQVPLKLTSLSEIEEAQRKIKWILDMRVNMRSTRQQAQVIKESGGLFKVSHHNLARWNQKYDGTIKSMQRAKPNFRTGSPAEIHAAKQKSKNRKDQFDFILGHIGNKKTGLRIAHEYLAENIELLGWGKAMSINTARRLLTAIDPAYRPAICKDNEAHYTRFAGYVMRARCKSNEAWQADEFEFAIRSDLGRQTKIYCVATVDYATGVIRHVEASLRHINKTTFVAAFKKSMLPNPRIGIHRCAKPIKICVDNAGIHDKKKFLDKGLVPPTPLDFQQSAAALNILTHYNHEETPRENCIVENFNGNFKRQFVKDFAHFVRTIAPAMNTLEWITHLEAFPLQLEAFLLQWNTMQQADHTSRIEKYVGNEAPGTLDVTEEQIDQAVRVTLERSYTREYGIRWDKDNHYHNPAYISKLGRELTIRVRPEGPGPDLEAYENGIHLGTLFRVEDHPDIALGLLAGYNRMKADIDQKQELVNRRFLDYDRQVCLLKEKYTAGQKAQIRRAMAADQTAAIPVPEPTEVEPTAPVIDEAAATLKGVTL